MAGRRLRSNGIEKELASIMRNLKRVIVPLAAIALMVGCNQSDNTSSTDSTGRASRSETPASRTSRDTDANSRVYSRDTNNSAADKAADNTGRNVLDRSDAAVTPGDQGNNESDLKVTQSIRRAISTNDQFSALAKNIKVITANGKATLRGPVENEQEKQGIESTAKGAAPGATIDNQLDVKTTNQ
jgi:hyperosmotically inducible periplasmic protein